MLVATGAVAVAVMLCVAAGSRGGSGEVIAEKRGKSEGSSVGTSQSAGAMSRAGATTQAVGGAGPATGATTQSARAGGAASRAVGPASAAVALPAEFAIFQTRSPFGKGAKKAPATAGGPEASFVLKGAVDVGGKLTAFVEDLGAKRVVQVAVGEAIARGKVKTITLDSIEYEAAGGGAKRIEVGQNLMGVVVPPTPTSKPAGPPGAPGQPGGPEGAPGAVPGQPGMPPGAVPGKPVRVQAVPAPGQ
jgi:hypothetical protein